MADWTIFTSLWLQKPLAIAAANPSGKALARCVGGLLDLDRQGHVLELGAGTGPLTRGLVEAGCPERRLVLLEREPALAAILRRRFPCATVIEGDALESEALLRQRGIEHLAAAVSSLPIKWFSLSAKVAVVHGTLALLGEGGRFLQVTNALASPLPAESLGLVGEEVARVWRNFLPAQVWAYRLAPPFR
jgi:phosphatidylethanolamine/phosphatidyl-N-methylethanolamine N-methyltransferase